MAAPTINPRTYARPSPRSIFGLGALVFCVLTVVLSSFGSAQAEPKFPPLTGRIVDEANLLSSADKAAIVNDLKALDEKSSDQVIVYTTKSLQGYAIEDFGFQLGRAWGVGQKGTNNGAILIIAPTERKVRIEVGRGLEPQLTDLMTKIIIQNAILPALRRGDFASGIKAGVHDIRDTLLGDAEAVKQRAAARPKTMRQAPASEIVKSLIFMAVIIFIVFVFYRSQQNQATRRGAYQSGIGGFPIIIPGGWGGGGSGGRGGSGGGSDDSWSGGGGGDFGGGGASGDW